MAAGVYNKNKSIPYRASGGQAVFYYDPSLNASGPKHFKMHS